MVRNICISFTFNCCLKMEGSTDCNCNFLRSKVINKLNKYVHYSLTMKHSDEEDFILSKYGNMCCCYLGLITVTAQRFTSVFRFSSKTSSSHLHSTTLLLQWWDFLPMSYQLDPETIDSAHTNLYTGPDCGTL